MTLDSKLSKAVYQGNDSTTVFPFAFKVWDSSQIAVTVTDAAGVSTDVTSNCTVTLTSSGGSVAYPKTGTPLPSGAKLAITRNMPFTQGINLTTASRFDPQVLEDGLDQATAERQQILEQMARAVILPPTSNESPEDVVQSIYTSRDAAAASASAASNKADAAEASAQAAANSATTAAQTVETATADAVSAATAQANAAHDSALAAAQSAAEAEAAVPDNLVARVADVEGVAASAKAVTDLVTETPGAGKIPKAGSGGKIPDWAFDVGDLVPSLATSKTGFVLCNGGAYSRTTYAALFAILGTSFGAGDGSTTFNVPDFRGRTFQGANANLKAVLAAGLPNITGYFAGFPGAPSGAFGYLSNWLEYGGVGNFSKGIDFSASRSSAIYGASTTVQPPAIATNIFIKY